ncbi:MULTISPECIES: DUF1488 family protein [Paraburkholderia]|uniref:DUF1488 domain-containing protein n=1 Tax=Paraburkholderia acidicola TaxID=1912599 RepID=A0ABV1LYL3_9BURK
MHVTFPDESPVFDGASLVVRFVAVANNEPVVCAITAEALEDHFGADSALEAAMLAAFDRGRGRIRAICAEALDGSGGEGVTLHSGLFRIAEAGASRDSSA